MLFRSKGEIIYDKAFGHYEYGPSPSMAPESIFDLASVTKVSATTVSIMKLYEEGKIKPEVLFYIDAIGLTWEQMKEKYLKEVGR